MNTKQGFINNVLVQMSPLLGAEEAVILERILIDELSNISMEGITTLPASYISDVDGKNRYIIELFIQKKRLVENTKKQYLMSVRKLLVQIPYKALPDMEGSDIQYYINTYVNRLRGGALEPTTINNERRNLSAFFRWMIREGFMAKNPADAVEPLWAPVKPIDYFAEEDLLMLRDACENTRERAIIEVMRSTGARPGELLAVTIRQVDMVTGDIPILSEKRGNWRTLYLDAEARHYLKKYLAERTDPSPYLFPQARYPYGKLGIGGLRALLKKIGKRAGLSCRVYPYKMRKTLGMTLINREVDVGVVSAVLGHANTAVTCRHYARMTPNTLRRIRDRVA